MEDGLFPGHRAMDSEEGLEEERRLCYVGMTRAKERLFLTSAAYRILYGQGDYTRESKFLRELDRSVLDPAGDMAYVPTLSLIHIYFRRNFGRWDQNISSIKYRKGM